MEMCREKKQPGGSEAPDIQTILNEIPGGIAVYEVGDTWKTLAYSDGLPKMQGYTKEEYYAAVEKNALDIVFEEDRPLLVEAVTLAVATNEQIHVSYRVYCKDGQTIWVNLSAYPGGYSENGHPIYHAIFSNSTIQFNLYQDVCDNSSTGILVLDEVSCDVYYVNAAMLSVSGQSFTPGIKASAQALLGSDMTEAERKLLYAENGEFIYKVPANGNVLHLHTRRIHWMRRAAILIYAVDITAEYRKQEELQRRYEDQVNYSRMASASSLASSMVNLTKNCITMQDTDNEDIMEVITKQTPQEGFESMYPHIPDEAIRKEYAAIFDRQAIIDAFDKGTTEKRIRHPFDSLDSWMESSYNAIRNPKTGDLEVYCFAKDVTNDVLQQDVSYALMENAYDDVILIHPQSRNATILIGSPDMRFHEAYAGDRDYEEALADFLRQQATDDSIEKTIEALRLHTIIAGLQKQKTCSVSFAMYDAKQRIVRKRMTFSYLNKYRTTILCTTQDTTSDFEAELAQRESLHAALRQARTATKAKSDFLSNISHDMRTPMNAIVGLSSLGMELETVEELKEYLHNINTSARQLLDLINDTLDINRIENRKLTLNCEYIMSSEMMMEAIASAKVIAGQKGVRFDVVGDEVLDRLLFVDKGKIVKIFNNILSNAIKFTPAGGSVTLTIKRLSWAGVYANYEISVKDTGIGISREFQEHIYEPFAQEHRDFATNMDGTGLGMTIVKEMVDFLGGRIQIESEPNQGTEIKVWLSFQIAGERPENMQKPGGTERLSGKHILLAEDHPLNAMIAKELLRRAGCRVTWVKDGEQCYDAFTSHDSGYFDCIVMDIRMPVLDGLEATKRIRSLERKDAKDIPILAMSANAYEEDVRKSLDAGMNAHIAKPIDPTLVYETLARYL